MNPITLKNLRRLIQTAELEHAEYRSSPLYAVEILLYIAMHQHDHDVHGEEIHTALKLKPDKVWRALKKHLAPYTIAVKGKKEGVRGPIKVFFLTPKGEAYIRNLIKEYEDTHNAAN